jgi:3-hydroxybutyrate dehydrogenase
MGQLDGRVAVITRCTRGLGRGLAESFLAGGASVVLNGRSPEKGRQALDEIQGGDAVRFVAGDALVRQDCESLIDEAISTFGKVDIMVNNAGGARNNAPVAELTDEAFDEALRWNVWSTFWCTRRALNDMIQRKWGRVINISSLEGRRGKPIVPTYVTSKHAINGFTDSCVLEVGPLGITVNSLCPGAMDTDIMREVGPQAAAAQGMTYEQLLEWFSKESATKQMMTEIADVAAVAVFLASDAGAGVSAR